MQNTQSRNDSVFCIQNIDSRSWSHAFNVEIASWREQKIKKNEDYPGGGGRLMRFIPEGCCGFSFPGPLFRIQFPLRRKKLSRFMKTSGFFLNERVTKQAFFERPSLFWVGHPTGRTRFAFVTTFIFPARSTRINITRHILEHTWPIIIAAQAFVRFINPHMHECIVTFM